MDNPSPSYNDNETEIELQPVVGLPGTWQTKSLLLVSDDVDDLLGDDEDATPYGLDDELNDRTHIVQLKGKVKIAAIKIDGHEIPYDTRVPIPAYKKLDIQVYIASDSGVSSTSAKNDIDRANERLAQFGIYVEAYPEDMGFTMPDGAESRVYQSNLDAENFVSGNPQGTHGNIDDIQIFYCKELLKPSIIPGQGTPLWGFAVQEAHSMYGTPGQNSPAANTIFIDKDRGPFTLAHEIGHLLTQHGHYGGGVILDFDYENAAPDHKIRHALMRGTGGSTTNAIGAGKRLHQIEFNYMIETCRLLQAP